MSAVPRYAVIPTHSRPRELRRLVQSLLTHVDKIFVIDNASDPAVTMHDVVSHAEISGWASLIEIIHDDEQPPNLSRLWNVGIDEAQRHATSSGHDHWDIIMLNDDAVIPDGWFHAVLPKLRELDVVATSTGIIHPTNVVRETRVIGEGGLVWRLCAWAFVMRGEVGLRGDESMRWWYGDNDIDWTARTQGGVAVVPGPVVVNECANSTTVGVLAEQTRRDREAFITKWGRAPW